MAMIDHLNILAFGADLTGTNDSSGAIQKALDEALKGPCRNVHFPDGTYRMDSGVMINTGASDDTWNIHVFSNGGATLIVQPEVTAFTVMNKRIGDTTPPRGVHFEKLHLIQKDQTALDKPHLNEIGFYLRTPECKLDEIEISGFRGTGIRLDHAYLTSLHRCRLWHNGIHVEDEGTSQASEILGCRLYFAYDTALVWDSRGLTVVGGAIEQSAKQEMRIGAKADAIANFYSVHFEHKDKLPATDPMIVCGTDNKTGNVQVAFERCVFLGNESSRRALKFLKTSFCEVIGCWFQNFTFPAIPIESAKSYYERGSTVLPKI